MDFSNLPPITPLEDFEINPPEEEVDRVKAACELWTDTDKLNRPTFHKLGSQWNHDVGDGFLEVGNWIIDPEGDVLDIVHTCDPVEKFRSPTIMAKKKEVWKKHVFASTVYKEPELRQDYYLVCVTCGARPEADVDSVITLMLKRQEKMGV